MSYWLGSGRSIILKEFLIMIICKICGKKCSDRGIGTHVKNQHNMTPIQYYDTYYVIDKIPKPTLILNNTNLHVYGAGKLYKI
jgi:hypothetical protein